MDRRILLACFVSFWVAGCNSPPPAAPPNLCVDQDGDGYDSCVDCKDDDRAVHPGAPESCNGKDDDCSGATDEGCGCKEGDAPRACGAEGGGCIQACVNGQYGECRREGASAAPDLTADPQNCGECGRACAAVLHAAARCKAGACGRGPCEPGYFDLDGAQTPGCEVACVGKSCTDENGDPVAVDAVPVPETGMQLVSPHAGSTYGGGTQTTISHTNTGFVGAGLYGASPSSNGDYQNFGGFTALERK